MIGQRRRKLTQRQEREAYAAATDRDNGRCQRCGLNGPTDRDHRQNRDAFNTTPANLQLLGGVFGCGCHRWKTLHPKEATEQGFSVPSWADPREWPAMRFGVGWVLYFDAPDERGRWWRPITDEEAHARMLGGDAA